MSDADLDDLVERAELRLCAPTFRYRGAHGERSARSLLRTVGRNLGIDALRRRRREARSAHELAARERIRQQHEAHRLAAERLVERVWPMVMAQAEHDRTVGQGSKWDAYLVLVYRQMWTQRCRHTELVERGYIEPGCEDLDALKRAGARLDKHRLRGRKRLDEILSHLVRRRRLDADEADEFRRLHRLKSVGAEVSERVSVDRLAGEADK